MIKLYCGDSMGLFSRKLDLEKDKLVIRFDLNDKVYKVYKYNGELIDYSFLNRKTRKILDIKNNELKTNNELMQSEIRTAKSTKRFNKLKEMGYICNSFEVLGKVNGTMSKEMEEFLNRITTEENVLLGIHRVGSSLSEEQINDILINGLMMTSHSGSGASANIKLEDNVSYYSDNHTIIKELMYANMYKNSTGSILIRIPDSDLTSNIFITNNNGNTVLNPKYILGYVPVDENHHIDTMIRPKHLVKSDNINSSDFDVLDFYNQVATEELTEDIIKTR